MKTWKQYCHPDYDSEPTSQDAYTGGVDICGDREIEGHCVIGERVTGASIAKFRECQPC